MSGAKEAKKEEGKEEGAAPAKSGGGRKIVPMLIAVLVVLGLQAGMAIGIVRWVGIADHAKEKTAKKGAHGEGTSEETGHGEGEGEEEEEEEGTPKKLECVETKIEKTISVSGTGGQKYLKTALCLEYDANKYKDLPKIIETQMMRVEFVVNRVLSTAPPELIMAPEGQDTLTAQITTQVNKMLKHEKIKLNAVLVTEWLVQ